jgi:hypothetical protein
VVRMDRTERRAKPRWMERMDAEGLPHKVTWFPKDAA